MRLCTFSLQVLVTARAWHREVLLGFPHTLGAGSGSARRTPTNVMRIRVFSDSSPFKSGVLEPSPDLRAIHQAHRAGANLGPGDQGSSFNASQRPAPGVTRAGSRDFRAPAPDRFGVSADRKPPLRTSSWRCCHFRHQKTSLVLTRMRDGPVPGHDC